MERRTFSKNSLLTAGGVLLGGTAVFRLLKGSEPVEDPRPATIGKVHQGNGKNVLVLMTAGDNNENTFNQALSYFHVISGVLGGRQAGTYLAGDCTGCEKRARHIAPEHLEKAYKMGLKL